MGAIKSAIIQALSPWAAAIAGDANFELAALSWFIVLVAIRRLTLSLAARAPRTKLSEELHSRPTVVPVMLHSLVTTLGAATVFLLSSGNPSDHTSSVEVWRRVILPFSSAYWLFDLVFYCWPKSDWLIAIHHVAILLCNYPVGDNAGRAAVEALNQPGCNVVLASVNGYLAEATTFLLCECRDAHAA